LEPVSFRDEVVTLVVDVGVGTTDILGYTGDPDYSPRTVQPSRTSTLAQRVLEMNHPPRLAMIGLPMGGGPLTKAIKRLMKEGTRVYAEPEAALTLHNDPDVLRDMDNLEIVENPLNHVLPTDPVLHTYDFDPNHLRENLERWGTDPYEVETVIACVQDHGYSPGYESARKHRFEELFARALRPAGARLEDMLYRNPPENFPRLNAAHTLAQAVGARRTVTADSKIPVAMLGRVDSNADTLLVIDHGTGHTTAFLIEDDRILGVYEHHTRLLDREKLLDHLKRFVEGDLTTEEVYRDGGHGAINVSPMDWDDVEDIVSTGPKREEFEVGRKPETVPDHMMPAYGPAMYLGV